MPEGTEIKYVVETPQEGRDSSAETRGLNDATYNSEEKVESGDYQRSEELHTAFVDSVPLVPLTQTDQKLDALPVEDGQDQEEYQVKVDFPHITDAEGDQEPPPEDYPGQGGEDTGTYTLPDVPDEVMQDGESLDPGDHYSGVEMVEGKVEKDSDWNEDPIHSEQPADGTTTQQMVDAADQASEPGDRSPERADDSSLAVEDNLPEISTSNEPSAQVDDLTLQPAEETRQDKVDHFTSLQGTIKDEVGEFRQPGKHGDQEEIPAPDPTTATDREQPVWGDGPAPPGLFSQVEDNNTVPKDQLGLADDDSQERDPEDISSKEEGNPKASLEDLVESTLPWPYHQDLPGNTKGSIDTNWLNDNSSVPIVTTLSIELKNEIIGMFLKSSYDMEDDSNGDRVNDELKKMPLSDLVLSVLPWPYHKDLPTPGSDSDHISLSSTFSNFDENSDAYFRWIPYLNLDFSNDDDENDD